MIWNDNATWDDGVAWVDAAEYDVVYASESTETAAPGAAQNKQAFVKSVTTTGKASVYDVEADTDTDVILPSEIYIEKILVKNNTANTGQISFGTTSGGTEIKEGQSITGSTVTIIDIGAYFSTVATMSVNDNGASDNWNSMNVDVHIIFWKL